MANLPPSPSEPLHFAPCPSRIAPSAAGQFPDHHPPRRFPIHRDREVIKIRAAYHCEAIVENHRFGMKHPVQIFMDLDPVVHQGGIKPLANPISKGDIGVPRDQNPDLQAFARTLPHDIENSVGWDKVGHGHHHVARRTGKSLGIEPSDRPAFAKTTPSDHHAIAPTGTGLVQRVFARFFHRFPADLIPRLFKKF